MVILVMLIVIRLRIPTNRATEIMAAIAALVLRPFLATFWVSRGSVVTIKIILV